MAVECEVAQQQFLQRGGVLQNELVKLQKDGVIEPPHKREFKEYPKYIRIHRGTHEVERSTETVKGKDVFWTETQDIWEEHIVNSEAEEAAVLAGGKTESQIEAERQDLIVRLKQKGRMVDPAWSAVRLRKELGEAADEAPRSEDEEEAALVAELERLKRKKAMREQIAALRAEIAEEPSPAPIAAADAESDEAEDLRIELRALGRRVDMRWGVDRLRQELDAATAPKAA